MLCLLGLIETAFLFESFVRNSTIVYSDKAKLVSILSISAISLLLEHETFLFDKWLESNVLNESFVSLMPSNSISMFGSFIVTVSKNVVFEKGEKQLEPHYSTITWESILLKHLSFEKELFSILSFILLYLLFFLTTKLNISNEEALFNNFEKSLI